MDRGAWCTAVCGGHKEWDMTERLSMCSWVKSAMEEMLEMRLTSGGEKDHGGNTFQVEHYRFRWRYTVGGVSRSKGSRQQWHGLFWGITLTWCFPILCHSPAGSHWRDDLPKLVSLVLKMGWLDLPHRVSCLEKENNMLCPVANRH